MWGEVCPGFPGAQGQSRVRKEEAREAASGRTGSGAGVLAAAADLERAARTGMDRAGHRLCLSPAIPEGIKGTDTKCAVVTETESGECELFQNLGALLTGWVTS